MVKKNRIEVDKYHVIPYLLFMTFNSFFKKKKNFPRAPLLSFLSLKLEIQHEVCEIKIKMMKMKIHLKSQIDESSLPRTAKLHFQIDECANSNQPIRY